MNSFDNFGLLISNLMKKYLLLFIVVFLASCQNPAAKKKETVDAVHNAKNSLDYVGTYKGILPCADCKGLETEVVINENATFCIKTKYLGKGDKVFMQKGTFTWNAKGNTIILTDIQNAPNQYFVGENTLTQLDLSGKKISGSFADDYILSKQPTDTSAIENVSENNATVDLNNRIATTTTIEKVNPAVGKFTLAETKWKLISLNKKKVSQKNKKSYFLKLNSKDGRFAAYAGCNNIGGSYVMPSTDKLSFSDIFSTKMACPDMTLENNFSTMLSEVAVYKLEGETLVLFTEGKKILAKFEAIQ